METPEVPSTSAPILTLATSDLFISSFESISRQFPNTSPPQSFSLLSRKASLPSTPPKFPRSKLIPGTRFVVDGFKYAGSFSVSYFLSHFHSDHYTGLSSNWSKGLIFCSITTARLLIESLKISNHFVAPLPLNETVIIDGCEVTLVDANHCPGAVQFLFKVPARDGRDERYVHTGDFRYCDSMKLLPALRQFVGCDAVFLDTTYCSPKFVFPCQDESIDYIVNTISRTKTENESLKTPVLFLVATYVVGKERILLEISRRCNCLIHVDEKKMEILGTLGYGDSTIFTGDSSSSCIHVIGWNLLGETWPYFRPNFVKMKEIVLERGYSKAVGFVPTGWTYEAKRDGFAVRAKESLQIHLVPYSEHSSYLELKDYVKFLRPKHVVPTVGSDIEKIDSKHVIEMNKHFTGLVDEMANKHDFFTGFYSKPKNSSRMDSQGIVIDSGNRREAKVENNLQAKCLKANLVLDSDEVLSFSAQETVEEKSIVLNDKDMAGAAEKLHACLPLWVTQDQLLDLLSRSSGEIVEAVSDFYEHETELYEQVKGRKDEAVNCQKMVCLSRLSSTIKVGSDKSTLIGESIISQGEKPCITSFPISSTFSPKKRGATSKNKSKKKARAKPAVDNIGSNQSTITKFFSKIANNGSQGHDLCDSTAKQCSGELKLLPDKMPESYKEDLDHFIQILNGSISRDHAASVIKEAKGDINLALDLYYSNSYSKSFLINEKNPSSSSIQKQDDVSCYNAREFSIGASIVELSKGDQKATLVTLPVEKYHPIDHACWTAGQPAPYLHLARTFDVVEKERGKIKAVGMLTNMFRSLLSLSPNEVLPAVYLCTNKIAADHENLELNIGGSLVSNSIEEACGTNRSKIREMYNSLGDLGDVAQVCRQTQCLLSAPRPLSIRDIFSGLRKISSEVGSGSTARKKNLIANLMRSCREMEIKFLVRTLVCNLRIGAMIRTVLPALAQATVLNSSHLLSEGAFESLKPLLQSISTAVVEAYNILPNLDLLVPSLLNNNVNFCSTTLSMIPGIPIKPMLARITNGIDQALKLFHGRAFTCEYKYDGQRAQIHKLEDGCIRVFSRSGEEATSKFPDVVNIIRESCKPSAKTFILDAEVVAVDRKNGNKLLSFQQLSSRERGGRDSLVTLDNIKVFWIRVIHEVSAYAPFSASNCFDLPELLISPLRERRKYLKILFDEEKIGYLEFAKEITVEADESFPTAEATLTKVTSFLENAFNSSCEGVMVKSLDIDAGYAASRRTEKWLKVKRDYIDGLNDSLDLVPIGAWHGNGRKAGWFSPYLMACYNPDTEDFESVCRVMSGFSDAFYTEMKEFFAGDKILSRKPPYYQTAEVPDVWFSPELVWAIRGADFTISPVHHAALGLVHPSRGVSIRFPRFIRSVVDRKPEDCSTSTDVADMFQSQTRTLDVRTEE